MQDTIEAYARVSPASFREAVDYIKNITQVEVNGGVWKSGKGVCRLRLPSELFHSLRKVFNIFAPDEPPFGEDSSDIDLLIQVCPEMTREGANPRHGRGKGRK